jgi:cardiolipin synthase (CMP-forming)
MYMRHNHVVVSLLCSPSFPLSNRPSSYCPSNPPAGPAISYLILSDQWGPALLSLAISGWSDWLDGYVARRLRQESVIGTYLDPFADKVLICSVVGALGMKGLLPVPLVVLIVGKDVLLTGATTTYALGGEGTRAWMRGVLGWQRGEGGGGAAAAEGGGNARDVEEGENVAAPPPLLPTVRPHMVSKVNTVFQLGLVGLYLSQSTLGVPGEEVLWGAGCLTAATTVASVAVYARRSGFKGEAGIK